MAQQARRVVRGAIMVTLLAVCLLPAQVLAESVPEFYVGVESFAWREFGDFGEQLLEESGQRYAVGFVYHHVSDRGFTVQPRLEVFGGTVDYNGETQGGIPVVNETSYSGYRAELDLGSRFGSEVRIEPFVGLGIRAWDRELKDGVTILATPAYGYTEQWSMVYWRAGLRWSSGPNGDANRFVELGVRLPISTENTALLSRFSMADLTFEPGDQNAYFASAGFAAGGMTVTTYLETLRFKASAPVYEPATASYYYQPTSKADLFGVRLGVQF